MLPPHYWGNCFPNIPDQRQGAYLQIPATLLAWCSQARSHAHVAGWGLCIPAHSPCKFSQYMEESLLLWSGVQWILGQRLLCQGGTPVAAVANVLSDGTKIGAKTEQLAEAEGRKEINSHFRKRQKKSCQPTYAPSRFPALWSVVRARPTLASCLGRCPLGFSILPSTVCCQLAYFHPISKARDQPSDKWDFLKTRIPNVVDRCYLCVYIYIKKNRSSSAAIKLSRFLLLFLFICRCGSGCFSKALTFFLFFLHSI